MYARGGVEKQNKKQKNNKITCEESQVVEIHACMQWRYQTRCDFTGLKDGDK